MRNTIVCFLLSFGVAFWLAADATPAQTPPLTRAEAVDLAAHQHPQVEAAARRQDASTERITQARSGFMPQVAFSERYSRTNNPMWAFGTKLNQESITLQDFDPVRLNDPDGIDNFASTLSVRWPLYDSGQTRYGVRQAREGAAAAEQVLRRSRQRAMAGAAAAYDGWLLALARRGTIDRAITLSRAHLNMIADRHRAGFVVRSDLLRAQVRLAELEQQRLSADSQAAVAAANLNAAMGETPERTFVPADVLVAGRCLDRSMEEWGNIALAQRPEMTALTLQEAIARAEIDKCQAAHHPSLSLFGDYELNTEDFSGSGTNYTVGALVQLNLFSGYRDVARTREARAAMGEVQAQRRELEIGIRLQIRQAYLEAASAWRRIAVAEAGAGQAEENLRIVAERYRNGLVTVLQLLDAETILEQARLNRLQAICDYRAGRVRLLLAAGSIDVADF